MASGPGKSGLEKWQDGIRKAVDDPRWNSYDCEIKMAISEFDQHLRSTTGYRTPDWQLIKAMLWTESGAASPEWDTKPMQIGVIGDPGLTSLLSGKEGGDLILPPAMKSRLSVSTVRTMPSQNIRAGIGYLLMRMATFEFQSVLASGINPIKEIQVKVGDSFEKIAKAQGTTVQILKELNPFANVLRTGQTIKFQKGKLQLVIADWRPINSIAIARRYNGGGDHNYAQKLDFALSLIRKGKEAVCES